MCLIRKRFGVPFVTVIPGCRGVAVGDSRLLMPYTKEVCKRQQRKEDEVVPEDLHVHSKRHLRHVLCRVGSPTRHATGASWRGCQACGLWCFQGTHSMRVVCGPEAPA